MSENTAGTSTGYFGAVPENPEQNLDQSPSPPETLSDPVTAYQERIGVTIDRLKSLFAVPENAQNEKIKLLVNRLRDIISGGVNFSLRDWRIYAAIDEAYNVSYAQINPTLIRKIISSKSFADYKSVVEEFARWGINAELLYDTIQGADGEVKKVLKENTFWRIFIPLVKSYLMIRLAKIYNDRDQTPFLKYEPHHLTDESYLIGEILTELVERMVQNYGYKAVFRQVILQTLKYGFAFVFPAEAWHEELVRDDEGDGKHAVKQGLRYNIPHPTKVAWDLNFRPTTFNTDTGCEWAFYWRIYKYKDIWGNPFFWNKDQIKAASVNWPKAYPGYFENIDACTMAFLTRHTDEPKRDEAGALYYSNNDHEKAVLLSDLFIKLCPKDWGLGDYEYPIWFRFVIANDDTVIYAEPLAYKPVLYCGYDEDQNQARNPSLAMEIMPHQDLLGNLMSQWVLSLYQNCKQFIVYDASAISQDALEEIKSTAKSVEKITWMGIKSRQLLNQGTDVSKLFYPISFPKTDVGQFAVTMDKVLTILERALNMSAAETGAAGAHVQTAEEIRVIANAVSNRVAFTAAAVDDFVDAWKRQLADALRVYSDREFIVEVNLTDRDKLRALRKIGFELVDDSGKTVVIRGNSEKVVLNTFISSREFQQRTNNPQVANVILQNLATISKTPLAAHLSPAQLADIFNRVNRLMGGPRDWKINVEQQPQAGEAAPGMAAAAPPEAQQQQLMQNQNEEMSQAIQQMIVQTVQQNNQMLMEQLSETIKPMADAVTQLQQIVSDQQAQLQQVAQAVAAMQNPVPVESPIGL